ncbi:MAG: hypothetical protein EXS08_16250 [Planctomycetes bacterium]|nr:hypothetical protein [Planctomycetota bacterium]
MSATVIRSLAERLGASDPANAHEQRELFERIRDLRSAFDGPLDPESHRCLEAAGMLIAYLARMGVMAGEDVRSIAVRLLRNAAEAEEGAGASKVSAPPAAAGRPQFHKVSFAAPSAPPDTAPAPLPERSATEVMGEAMLGQILLQRGQILEEHIHQAMKVQRTTSMRMGDILVKIGAATRQQVADALSSQSSSRRVRENLGPSVPTQAPDTRGTGLKLMGEVLLGELLIERGVITRRQLERALEVQKASGVRVGEALVKIGAASLEHIEQALRVQGKDRRGRLKNEPGPLDRRA